MHFSLIIFLVKKILKSKGKIVLAPFGSYFGKLLWSTHFGFGNFEI